MWKSIKEWEGLYSINENGDIKNDKTGKLIVGDKNNCGYCRVCLYDKQNNRKQRYQMKTSLRTIGAAVIVFAATACGNGNGKGAA